MRDNPNEFFSEYSWGSEIEKVDVPTIRPGAISSKRKASWTEQCGITEARLPAPADSGVRSASCRANARETVRSVSGMRAELLEAMLRAPFPELTG